MSQECHSCPMQGGCTDGSCDLYEAKLMEMYEIASDTSEGVMVLVEWSYVDGVPQPTKSGIELLSLAHRLGEQRVFAVIFGPQPVRDMSKELFAWGADTVYHIRHPSFDEYQEESFATGLAAVVERVKPGVLLFAAEGVSRNLAPEVAARLGVSLTTDCTEIKLTDGVLSMTRPVFGGRLMMTIITESRPQMATLQLRNFQTLDKKWGRRGTVINWPMQPEASHLREEKECNEAELVLLGKKIDPENLELLKKEAERIKEEISCISSNILENNNNGKSRNASISHIYILLGRAGAIPRSVRSEPLKLIAIDEPDSCQDELRIRINGKIAEFLPKLLERLDSIDPAK